MMVRERPFNLKGGLCFFSKKIFWFQMLLKKILWFWWRKKKINIPTLVLSENKFLNETKNHNPPIKLNGRSLSSNYTIKKTYLPRSEVASKETIIIGSFDILTLFPLNLIDWLVFNVQRAIFQKYMFLF
jgi:hypothetical protein